jgi:hypothetical protein
MGGLLSNIFATITGTKHAEDLANKRRTYTQLEALHNAAAEGKYSPEAFYESGIELAKMGGKYGKPLQEKLTRDYENWKQQQQAPPPIRVPQLVPPPQQGVPPPESSSGPSAGGGIPFPQAPTPPPDQGTPPPSLTTQAPVPTPRPTFLPYSGSEQAVKGVQANIAAANAMEPLNQQQLNLKLAQLNRMIGPERMAQLTPQDVTEFVSKGVIPYAPVHAASEGSTLFNAAGQQIGQGQPKPVDVAPGHNIFIPQLTPPPGQGAAAPQMTQVASGGPEPLTAPEAQLLSSAQQVAEKHGLPFDPTKTPRNPYAQIPVRYHAEVKALNAEQQMDPATRASLLASRASMEGLRQVQENNAKNQRADRSYTFHVSEMDKLSKPVTDLVGRLGRLEDTLSQNTPQADALVAPELLTVMAGGPGSGLRMNEAEIARIIGGRSKWEDLKASINKWKTDPKAARSITPAQQQQIRSLVSTVGEKLKQKQALIDAANNELINANDPVEHRQSLVKLRKAMTSIDQGTAAPTLTPPPGKIHVQIPGNPPGYIDAASKDQFLRENPGAKVIQ